MASLLQTLRPMLPSAADGPFDSPDHLFDLKWGGVRALAHCERGGLRLISQAGREVTAWFPEMASVAAQVRQQGACVLDGEVVALDDDGRPDLALLAPRLAGAPPEGTMLCLYQAYDLLYAGGRSLLEQPLAARRDALQRALRAAGPALLSEAVEGEGVAYFQAATERRLPGIVAKLKDSPYAPGKRTRDWLEVRVYESGWFVAGGYALGLSGEPAVAGLLVGEPLANGRLRYAGMVRGHALPEGVEAALGALSAPACPFLAAPPVPRLVYWLRPEVVCEVRYGGRESDGRLRFPVFVTLRPDLGPEQCLAPDAAASRAN